MDQWCHNKTTPNEKKGKGAWKKKNPNSKHGVFGKVVHEYGPKGTGHKPNVETSVKVTTSDDNSKETPKSTAGNLNILLI